MVLPILPTLPIRNCRNMKEIICKSFVYNYALRLLSYWVGRVQIVRGWSHPRRAGALFMSNCSFSSRSGDGFDKEPMDTPVDG